jgi:hypothetical protein
MSAPETKKAPPAVDDFAQNARPTARGVAESLTVVRRRDEPFSSEALGSRLDLLLLPFLRDIPTLSGRVARLQSALALAADQLAPDHEVAYRHVFLAPEHEGLEQRRRVALEELQAKEPFRELKSATAVRRIEDRMLPLLANVLLDVEFHAYLEEQEPRLAARASNTSSPARPALQLVSANTTVDIEAADCRKTIVHRRHQYEALAADQRVAAIRYHARTTDPMPVDGSVKLLDDKQTYLGTLPDHYEGAVADWLVHFVHFGGPLEPGACVGVDLQVELFDKDERDPHPNITLTVDHVGINSIDLAIRLPEQKRGDAHPEARVISGAHSLPVILEKTPLSISRDGWAKIERSDLAVGLQYGIFFPGFHLYK